MATREADLGVELDYNVKKQTDLSNLKPGEKAVIKEVPEHSLLAPLGFRLGKRVKVMSKQYCGGPIVAQVDGRTSAIDREVAEKIKLIREY